MFFLLIIIYIAFISLGLPDSLLGSAWPSMYENLNASIAYAGIVSMTIAGGTIISSLCSDRIIRKLGTGLVTFFSVLMTALALLGFSLSHTFTAIVLWAIPLGLGAGSVDAALNNFVALNYKANHMSWLHCFWGLGASAGPVIMSFYLMKQGSWAGGYKSISILQFGLAALLLFTLPLWKKAARTETDNTKETQTVLSIKQLLKFPGAKAALVAFFCYCALETTVGLWGSTYLVTTRNLSADTAARWISFYYGGITLGRFFSGFLAMKLQHKQMVRLGQGIIGIGVLLLLLPLGAIGALAGLFGIGLGCAPIYPSLLHETPENFGSEYSQAIMGIQMACAYTGTTCMPPVFGFIASITGYQSFPVFVGGLLAIMAIMVNILYKKVKNGGQREENFYEKCH